MFPLLVYLRWGTGLLALFVYLPCTYLFVKRLNRDPLRQRHRPFLLCQIAYALAWSILNPIGSSFDLDCLTGEILFSPLVYSTYDFLLLRVWALKAQYDSHNLRFQPIQENASNLQRETRRFSLEKEAQRLYALRWLMHPEWYHIALLCISSSLIHTVPVIVVDTLYRVDPTFEDTPWLECGQSAQYVAYAPLTVSRVFFYVFIATVYSAVRLREVIDAYAIKREFKNIAKSVFVMGNLFLLANLVINPLLDETVQTGNITMNIGTLLILYHSLISPLRRSYKVEKTTKKKRGLTRRHTLRIQIVRDAGTGDATTPESEKLFEAFLGTKEGFDSFMNDLIRQFSTESLLFIRDVDAYEASYDEKTDIKRSEDVKNINRLYLQTDSPYEVNISHNVRIRINLEKVRKTMFESARHEILHLLLNDCLPRYVATDEGCQKWEKFKNQIEQEQFYEARAEQNSRNSKNSRTNKSGASSSVNNSVNSVEFIDK